MMKNALSKVIGRALLRFEELEEVLLHVESFLNNRPLCYIGEEFETPVITPNLLLRGEPAPYLEENRDEVVAQVMTSVPLMVTPDRAAMFNGKGRRSW